MGRGNTTWRKEIEREMREHEDKATDFACTLDGDALDVGFYPGYGGSNGKPFTAWTPNRVYFPVVYDGAEWVGSVPRNPCDEASGHHGGE